MCDQPRCGHHACLTGPGGNWCADHLEPHQRRVNAPAFVPTSEWQDVPDGVVLPPDGLQIEMNMTTGRNRARLHPGDQEAAAARPDVRPDGPLMCLECGMLIKPGEATVSTGSTSKFTAVHVRCARPPE